MFFLTGIWMDGRFADSMEGWWFGIFDLVFLYFPLALYLSHRYCSSPVISDPPGWKYNSYTLLRLMVIIGVYNLLKTARNLSIWYEFLSGLISPVKLWWALIVIYIAFIKPATPKFAQQ